MAIRIVRLGAPRLPEEGIRLGTVRRPPRGIARADYSRLDYFDVWLPDLAPSASLLAWVRTKPLTDARWASFARRYAKEMRQAPASRLIQLLAAISRDMNLSVGCFCPNERHCHRSVLRELLEQAGAEVA
jgi:uncharacterized protein YeaO (DUF488 family)